MARRERNGWAERNALERTFGRRYRYAPAGWCVYCGQACGRKRDHVPPIRFADAYGEEVPHWVYPCCRPCNYALGAMQARCLVPRARYVRSAALSALSTGAADVSERLRLEALVAEISARLRVGLYRELCLCGTVPPKRPRPAIYRERCQLQVAEIG